MTPKQMDEKFGTKDRFNKIAYNLNKFYKLDRKLHPYHEELLDMGLDKVMEIGVRKISRDLADKHNVKRKTIKHDIGIMKRYGSLK